LRYGLIGQRAGVQRVITLANKLHVIGGHHDHRKSGHQGEAGTNQDEGKRESSSITPAHAVLRPTGDAKSYRI
jgi:hypothetical protein